MDSRSYTPEQIDKILASKDAQAFCRLYEAMEASHELTRLALWVLKAREDRLMFGQEQDNLACVVSVQNGYLPNVTPILAAWRAIESGQEQMPQEVRALRHVDGE